jgi:subtilisin
VSIEDQFRYRRAVCVIARVGTNDPREIQRLARYFDAAPGTRGAMLAHAAASGGVSTATSMQYYPRLGAIYGAVTHAGYRRLCKQPHVLEIYASGTFHFIRPLATGDELFAPVTAPPGPTWGLKWLNIPQLWAWNLTGAGVVVGHLDSGLVAHPALTGAVADLVTAQEHNSVTPGSAPGTNAMHGTHTAATIVGRPVGGVQVGVAPGAVLVSANITPGGDTVARLLSGIDWALGKGARVLNMSVGQDSYNPAFEFVINKIRSYGCLPVCAAGNNGEGSSMSPANYPNALSVGAQDPSGRVGWFSGSEMLKRPVDPGVPDLIAPGVDVVSASVFGGFATSTGTSMAAPHIAGMAALLLHAYRHATIAQLEMAILASCRSAPWLRADRAGRGVPDPVLALQSLQAQGAT